MDQKHDSQLLFIHPQDPQRSFFYAYKENNSRLKEKIIGDLVNKIEEEKECYFEFTDVFGREVPDNSTEEYFKALQPFYIKRMVPKVINLHITRNDHQKVTYEIDPEKTLILVKKFVEESLKIPVAQQKYFIGERKLFDEIKLINQQISEKDVEIQLDLKPRFIIKHFEESFELYHELKDFGSELIWSIRQKNKNLKDAEFSVFHGDNLLSPDTTLEKSGLKPDDILEARSNIRVSISGSVCLFKHFAPPTQSFEVKKHFMGQKHDLLGDDFDLQYKGFILADDQPLSAFNLDDKNHVELEIKPKPGSILIQFGPRTEKFSPSLVIMNENQTIGDIIQHSFRRQYHEGVCKFTYQGTNLPHNTVLKDICPGNDILQLKYNILWAEIYSGFQIFLVTLTGERIIIYGHLEDSVRKLKEQIDERLDLRPDQQRIIFAGKQLEDAKTLGSYNIRVTSLLHLVLRLRGGGGGFDFADITQDHKAKSFEWSNTAPAWRMAKRGLCLEGKCDNLQCQAFGCYVIINKGMGTYDLVYNQHENKCPMCLMYVKIEKCGFNNCRYGYTRIKLQEGGLPPQKVTSQEEIEVGDCYKLFDPEMTGKANWLTLKIVTKYVDDKTAKKGLICGICREEVKVSGGQFDCSHVYHDECLQRFRSGDIGQFCAFCHF